MAACQPWFFGPKCNVFCDPLVTCKQHGWCNANGTCVYNSSSSSSSTVATTTAPTTPPNTPKRLLSMAGCAFPPRYWVFCVALLLRTVLAVLAIY